MGYGGLGGLGCASCIEPLSHELDGVNLMEDVWRWLEVAGSTRRQCLLRCCLGRRQQVHQCLPQEGRSGAEQRKDSTNGNMLRWKFEIKMNKELKAIPLLWDACEMLLFYSLSVPPDLCGGWKNKPYIHNMQICLCPPTTVVLNDVCCWPDGLLFVESIGLILIRHIYIYMQNTYINA